MKKYNRVVLISFLVFVLAVSLTGCGGGGSNSSPSPSTSPSPSPSPPPTTDPNLIVNPGFEDGLNNWDLEGIYSIDSEAHSGTKALKLERTSIASQFITFTEEGVSLTFSGYGKIIGDIMVFLSLYFYSDDACTDEIGNSIGIIFTDKSAYQLKNITFTTPSGIRKIRINLQSQLFETVGSTLIDDLSLIKN